MKFAAELVSDERIGAEFPKDYSLLLASGVADFRAENPDLPLVADWTLGSLETDAALVAQTSATYAERYGLSSEVKSLEDLERSFAGLRPMRKP